MEANFLEITMPSGETVRAMVLDCRHTLYEGPSKYDAEVSSSYLCYGQNKLFTAYERVGIIEAFCPDDPFFADEAHDEGRHVIHPLKFGHMICTYCIMPEIDNILDSTK